MHGLRRLIGDRALGFSLVGRVWQTISGPITIALIIVTLSPAQQGVYYALVSIVGLQAFVELGLLNVLISYAGQESSRILPLLGRSEAAATQAERERSEQASARMACLLAGANRWFRWMSLVFAAAAILFGIWTLSAAEVPIAWLGPLVALVGTAAATVAISPQLAVLEGAGQREDVYRFRLLQIITGSLVVWLCLAIGWGIWSLVASAITQLSFALYLTRIRHAALLRQLQTLAPASTDVSWASEIVPAQWRMAAISLSQHVATQFLVLAVLTYRSAEDAGRLGLTLSITSAIQIIAQTWLQANLPLISTKHGTGQTSAAAALWRQLAITSTLVLTIGLFALCSALQLLSWSWPTIAARFVAPYQVAILAVGCLASHQLSIQGMYFLAKWRKPLTRAAVGGFLTTAALVWGGGLFAGIDGVISGYAVGLAAVTLPLHTLDYLAHRRRAGSSDHSELSAEG